MWLSTGKLCNIPFCIWNKNPHNLRRHVRLWLHKHFFRVEMPTATPYFLGHGMPLRSQIYTKIIRTQNWWHPEGCKPVERATTCPFLWFYIKEWNLIIHAGRCGAFKNLRLLFVGNGVDSANWSTLSIYFLLSVILEMFGLPRI